MFCVTGGRTFSTICTIPLVDNLFALMIGAQLAVYLYGKSLSSSDFIGLGNMFIRIVALLLAV